MSRRKSPRRPLPNIEHLQRLDLAVMELRRASAAGGLTPGYPAARQVQAVAELVAAARVVELREVERLRDLGIPWPQMASIYGVRSAQAVQQRVSRLRRSLSATED